MLATVALPSSVVRADDPGLDQASQLREQKAAYQSQQSQLEQNSNVSVLGLELAQAELKKRQAQVAEQNRKAEAIMDNLKQLKKVRDVVVRESYMATRDDNVTMALLSSGTLSEFLGKGQYSLFLLKRKSDAVGALSDQISALDRTRQDLITDQNGLESRAADLQTEIDFIKQQLANNKAGQADLDSQLAALTGLNAQIDRDFVHNNEPIGGRFAFAGGGTEHGLGMSQYGAKGAAEHGSDYRAILGHYYQGTAISNVGSFNVNGQGDSEAYLARVVSGEMSGSWPMEALKAQAVAARSYAYKNSGYEDCTPRTQACSTPNARATEAVNATRGEVVTYGGQVVAAYFHSTSGGHTENNENVWGGAPLAWLRGVPSPYETDSPHWSWHSKTYSREQMQGIVDASASTNVGTLSTIKIIGRGVGGRVTSMQIIGSAGTKTVSGPTFKAVFNAYSPDDEHGLESTLFGFY